MTQWKVEEVEEQSTQCFFTLQSIAHDRQFFVATCEHRDKERGIFCSLVIKIWMRSRLRQRRSLLSIQTECIVTSRADQIQDFPPRRCSPRFCWGSGLSPGVVANTFSLGISWQPRKRIVFWRCSLPEGPQMGQSFDGGRDSITHSLCPVEGNAVPG